MTKYYLLATAAILSMATAAPVFAQAAIEEPGAYAFYHPNGDPGTGGPGAGSSRSMESMASLPRRHSGSMAQAGSGRMPRQALVRHARSAKAE
jgi:hypothetical protein